MATQTPTRNATNATTTRSARPEFRTRRVQELFLDELADATAVGAGDTDGARVGVAVDGARVDGASVGFAVVGVAVAVVGAVVGDFVGDVVGSLPLA